jgi:hypothetical protein
MSPRTRARIAIKFPTNTLIGGAALAFPEMIIEVDGYRNCGGGNRSAAITQYKRPPVPYSHLVRQGRFFASPVF